MMAESMIVGNTYLVVISCICSQGTKNNHNSMPCRNPNPVIALQKRSQNMSKLDWQVKN
jgi:hypothetical protein